MKYLLSVITWPIRKILLFLIIGIRPLLGPANCRFPVTCGKYAIKQLQTEPLSRALWNIIKRLVSCANPFWKKTSSFPCTKKMHKKISYHCQISKKN